MAGAVAEHGWDGEWFRRAYDFFGRPVGSAANDEGQIFIEPQGMCVMAGRRPRGRHAPRGRSTSVAEQLATPHGIVLQQPAYSRYRLELGEITLLPAGLQGERAAIFCHTNPWIMIAEALVGDGDGAFDYYLRINPSAREELGELHRCEPYVYAQMIAGRDAPTHGEAKNSWLTGTAAWNFVAITQWILGIRPEHDGLRIDPCLPGGLGRLPGDAPLPRRGVPDRRDARRRRLVVDGRAGRGRCRAGRAGGRDRRGRGQRTLIRSTTNTSVSPGRSRRPRRAGRRRGPAGW